MKINLCFYAIITLFMLVMPSCALSAGDESNNNSTETSDASPDMPARDMGTEMGTRSAAKCVEHLDEASCLEEKGTSCGWFVLQGTILDQDGECACEGTRGFCTFGEDVPAAPYFVVARSRAQNPTVAYEFSSMYTTNDEWVACQDNAHRVCQCQNACPEVSITWAEHLEQ